MFRKIVLPDYDPPGLRFRQEIIKYSFFATEEHSLQVLVERVGFYRSGLGPAAGLDPVHIEIVLGDMLIGQIFRRRQAAAAHPFVFEMHQRRFLGLLHLCRREARQGWNRLQSCKIFGRCSWTDGKAQLAVEWIAGKDRRHARRRKLKAGRPRHSRDRIDAVKERRGRYALRHNLDVRDISILRNQPVEIADLAKRDLIRVLTYQPIQPRACRSKFQGVGEPLVIIVE